MGYRNTVLEQKIEECLSAVRRGETSITVDRGDLTYEEIVYIQNEVRRRLNS